MLRLYLDRKTELTRPKRFALHTFLGNQLSLARTRNITSLITTRSGLTTRATLNNVQNGLTRPVHALHSTYLSVLTRMRTHVSFRSSLPALSRRTLHRRLTAILTRMSLVLTATRQKRLLQAKLGITVMNHPGINGSDLLGT